jgi:hypothetical protein
MGAAASAWQLHIVAAPLFTQNSRTAFLARDGRIATLNLQVSITQIDAHFIESTDAPKGQGEGPLPR